MSDIPPDALREAEEAYACAYQAGVAHREIARIVVEAAAPWIAAQALIRERRRAVRLVRRVLVPRGCEPTKGAADLIDAIKGDLRV
ncbi:hypothetical protein ACFOY2_05130 [Nonomuraea purpurea]|uniref:DUF222 domain-containing protein n=1 Tax=Nonomuraea purpurea TaxID=1849276 RepID=A0ABV8G204_9ACTN